MSEKRKVYVPINIDIVAISLAAKSEDQAWHNLRENMPDWFEFESPRWKQVLEKMNWKVVEFEEVNALEEEK